MVIWSYLRNCRFTAITNLNSLHKTNCNCFSAFLNDEKKNLSSGSLTTYSGNHLTKVYWFIIKALAKKRCCSIWCNFLSLRVLLLLSTNYLKLHNWLWNKWIMLWWVEEISRLISFMTGVKTPYTIYEGYKWF